MNQIYIVEVPCSTQNEEQQYRYDQKFLTELRLQYGKGVRLKRVTHLPPAIAGVMIYETE